jgi:glutamate racemase
MIGVFDSGLGGLTVLKEFLKYLPEYDYLYLGDNARVPYGNKSQELIYKHSREAVDFLFSQGAEIIIFACNSASSQALRKIQTEYLPKKYPGKKVLGVIRPLAEEVAKNEKVKKVGVIGTRATINSHVYKEEIKALNPELEVIEKATPLLVPLIEENWAHKPEARKILKNYLRELKMKQVDALILACTHYPYMFKEIREIMPKRSLVLNPGEVVAFSLKDYISRHKELKLKTSKTPKRVFFTTDSNSRLKNLGERFLEENIKDIKEININDK